MDVVIILKCSARRPNHASRDAVAVGTERYISAGVGWQSPLFVSDGNM
eukprot:SAG11_NODE_3446_length_2443_cov_1.235922_4_plen_48_part_00